MQSFIQLKNNRLKCLHLFCGITQIGIADLDKLCDVTFNMYKNLYGWYPMPATLHKILAHSTRIMASLPLSTGYMGEQGFEARNNNYRNDRQCHSRKISRAASFTDVFHQIPFLHLDLPEKQQIFKGL